MAEHKLRWGADGRNHRVIAIAIILLSGFCFSEKSFALSFDKLGGTMVAYGEIVGGDFNKFVVEYLTWDAPPTVFAFDSAGGDVIEAMAIGTFVRASRIPIWITGKCYSACSLVYLSATTRDATGEIGLHRPYFDQSYFSGLSSYQAEKEYRALEDLATTYLQQMGTAQHTIDEMWSVSSDKMKIFRGREQTSEAFGQESIFMEEWKIARCGALNDSEVVASCAVTWIRYIRANVRLVENWEEKFLDNSDGLFRRHMPGMCQGLMNEVQSTVYKAVDDPSLLKIVQSHAQVSSQRGECIKKAEDSETWSFFRAMKSSEELRDKFLRPALSIVRETYGN